MPDTVPAMLEPGEFVIRKDAAEKIGMKNLEMLNNADRLESGNSAIDELIALSTLNGSQGMYGGGSVQKMPQSGYMKEGGVAKNLKEIPEGKPGLAKLPEAVRNKMGYMQMGGMVKDSIASMMGGGMAMKKDMMSYQKGGMVDDPLEIDMRMRSGNVQAIGVARPSSEKGILKELDRMQGDIGLLKIMRDRYKPSSFNEYRRMKEKSGDVMTMEEMMDVLNRAGGMTRDKFKIPEMQNGGSTYTYGSGETSVPTLADLYEQMGVQPIDKQKERFESLFTYDPTREETIVDEFQSNIESLREGAGRALGQARMASQTGGAGFAGFGERERMLSESRGRIQEQGIRGLESAQRGMFEDIRTQRDKYMSDAIAGLSELERAEGTDEIDRPQPPENPGTSLNEIQQGADGKMYRFTFNGWEYYSG